jgi:hypothetical protein
VRFQLALADLAAREAYDGAVEPSHPSRSVHRLWELFHREGADVDLAQIEEAGPDQGDESQKGTGPVREVADHLPVVDHQLAVVDRQRCCHAAHQHPATAAPEALEHSEGRAGIGCAADLVEGQVRASVASRRRGHPGCCRDLKS